MIGKIVTGKSFKGAVEYVMKKEGAQLLACDGVDATDARSITRSFNFQRKARPEMAEVVGHISLSFHRDDTPKLTNEMMIRLAEEYMQRMDITDTQYIVARHNDTDHPHIHILYNRVKYNAKLVRKHNERIRNVAVCKAIKQKYGLTFSEGKQNVKVEKLHGPDQVKYAIFGAVKDTLPRCQSLAALADELQRQGIATTFVHRGGDPEKEVQGLTFTKDAITFKASQVDRKFSYANLCKTIEQNRTERQRQEIEQRQRQEQTRSAAEFVRYLLGQEYDPSKLNPEDVARIADTERAEAEQQRQEQAELQRKNLHTGPAHAKTGGAPLSESNREFIRYLIGEKYDPAKLTPEDAAKIANLEQEQSRTQTPPISEPEAGHKRQQQTEERYRQVQAQTPENPVVFGVRLTDEQVQKIKDWQPVYLEGMRHENRLFSGYFVADDSLKSGWIYNRPPDEMVQYGHFKMRIMDRDMIERGFVVRALVEWYGGGQTARPYLWKEKPTDTDYKESWSDPRKPQNVQRPAVRHVPPVKPRQEQKPEHDWSDDNIPQRKRGRRM